MTEIESARAALDAGNLDVAEAGCRTILSGISAGKPQAICILGIVALLRKNYSEAVALFAQALQEGHVADTLLLNNYGEAYRRLGRLDEAFDCFTRALHLDSQQPYTYFNIALIRRAQGNARESEHYFRLAFILKPDLAQAHAELAELYVEEGHIPEAVEEYREAIAQGAGSPSGLRHSVSAQLLSHWHERLASLLLLRGATAEALSLAEQALVLDGNNAGAWYEVAKAKFELCHEAEAERCYLQAARIRPGMSMHARPRALSVRRRVPAEWAGVQQARYLSLAKPQTLQIAQPPTIPSGLSERFELGQTRIHELFSLRLRNAEIIPGDFAVITEDRTLLVDGIVNRVRQYERKSSYVKHGSDDMRMLLDLAESAEKYDGECVLLGRAEGQYAWFFEVLARLWAVEQQPRLASLPLAVDAGITESRLADLALFGYPKDRLVLVDAERGLNVEDLHVPSLCVAGDCVSPLAIQYLRRRLLPVRQSGRRRIYLSRMSCNVRRLANEEELLPLLRSQGFEVLNVESVDGKELTQSIGEAEAVLAMDDELLARLVVAPQGAHIGAIVTEGIYYPRAYLVSSQLAHDFVYLIGTPVFESHAVHENCDVRLTEESLRLFFDRL